MKKWLTRLAALCLCLCLCLASGCALAEPFYSDGTNVTRSDFELSFHLYADGFPDDGKLHYEDWETFLSKLSLRGTADAQSFPTPDDRVYVNAGLYLNDKLTIPFEYDGYYNFRYVRSPALGGASVHFQMHNFFQFMLKPYYYMGLPTQYAALLLYPEAAVELWNQYASPMKETFQGETVSYESLSALCEKLNAIVLEDEYDKAYYFFTCLLVEQQLDWTALEKLAEWDALLAFLDPDRQGMTIARTDGGESWTLGQTTVLEKTVSGDETAVRIHLPDPDGYDFSLTLQKTSEQAQAQLVVTLDGEERLNVCAGVNGLSAQGECAAQGEAWLEAGGSALLEPAAPLRLRYQYSRSAQVKPYDMALTVDVLNNETGRPGFGFTYQAQVSEHPHTVLVDREYDDQEDFFHLNESFLREYKERFLPTLALAAAPIALEVPQGVISDALAWMEDTGILAFLGLE